MKQIIIRFFSYNTTKETSMSARILRRAQDERGIKTIFFAIAMFVLANSSSLSYTANVVTTEVAVGELIDKITILRIKAKRITDPAKLKNIHAELHSLENTLNLHVPCTQELEALTAELQKVNEALWDIEDEIRDEERHQRFGDKFIQLARNVYFTNDRRCEIKRQMNIVVGSRFVEEKSYSDYRTTATH